MSVCQNLQHLSTLLPVIPLDWVIPHQVHGTQVLSVGDDYINAPSVKRREMLEGVDALVTDRRGFCLCVSTADCIPLISMIPVGMSWQWHMPDGEALSDALPGRHSTA